MARDTGNKRDDETWYQNLEKLKECQNTDGTFDVRDDKKFQTWVNNQRTTASRNKMPGYRKDALRQIGFSFQKATKRSNQKGVNNSNHRRRRVAVKTEEEEEPVKEEIEISSSSEEEDHESEEQDSDEEEEDSDDDEESLRELEKLRKLVAAQETIIINQVEEIQRKKSIISSQRETIKRHKSTIHKQKKRIKITPSQLDVLKRQADTLQQKIADIQRS